MSGLQSPARTRSLSTVEICATGIRGHNTQVSCTVYTYTCNCLCIVLILRYYLGEFISEEKIYSFPLLGSYNYHISRVGVCDHLYSCSRHSNFNLNISYVIYTLLLSYTLAMVTFFQRCLLRSGCQSCPCYGELYCLAIFWVAWPPLSPLPMHREPDTYTGFMSSRTT